MPVLVLASVLAVGCGDDADPASQSQSQAIDGGCLPGALLTCVCAGGAAGSQTCDATGLYVSQCFCGDAAPAAGTGGTGATGGTGGAMNGPPMDPQDSTAGMQASMMEDPATPSEPLPSSGCGAASWPQGGTHEIQSSGKARTYILRVPPGYDPNRTYNLMFVFHGLGVEPERITNSWGWNGFEGRAGDSTVFVAPRGQSSNGGGIGWGNESESLALTADLLALMRGSFCIDETRIFSTGSSYGGIMSNRVGCKMGDSFRAIGPIMGNGPASAWQPNPGCVGEVAAWITHGRNDGTVSFESGEASRDFWAAKNGCTEMTMALPRDECVEYVGCDSALPVVWCPTNNGHQDPPYAAEEIWNFFSRF